MITPLTMVRTMERENSLHMQYELRGWLMSAGDIVPLWDEWGGEGAKLKDEFGFPWRDFPRRLRCLVLETTVGIRILE